MSPVINVSGHHLGTVEIENVLAEYKEVAEAVVIGKKHDVKGESPVAFVVLRNGFEGSPALVDKLKKHVGIKLGPIARPEDIIFLGDLPKNRSGKVMRRLLRVYAEGLAVGNIATPANLGSTQEITGKYRKDEDQ
ncbi:MAG: hypothetical protein CVU89_13215 [Firmicutes bacterium HGW-Firmicutes-14]|nr:MAG: hypothetical protein CVU89_13215 [Firmicutes bacterium HGW-Firmicutes-14]